MRIEQKITASVTGISFILLISNIGTAITGIGHLFEFVELPPPIRMYLPFILFTWGVMSSMLGGALWGLFWKHLGDKHEPHGLYTLLWVIVTNLTTILSFLYVGRTLLQIDIAKLTTITTTFMIGACLGAWIFYNIPIKSKGIRNLFEQRKKQNIMNWLFWNEFWLVLIWSFIISFPAFFFVQLANCYFYGYSFVPQLYILFPQISLVICSTCCVVWCFIIIYPSIRKHAMARGLIAGITLRTTLFFGLFMGL